jgi:hypothetical protein
MIEIAFGDDSGLVLLWSTKRKEGLILHSEDSEIMGSFTETSFEAGEWFDLLKENQQAEIQKEILSSRENPFNCAWYKINDCLSPGRLDAIRIAGWLK